MNARVKAKNKLMERKVKELLQKHSINEYAKDEMAPHVARVSLMMNHLYEDLGFDNRIQMGKFMQKHFPTLAILKPKDKLWKKFIYDEIGEVAPACKKCSDQINCFACKV